MRIIPQIQDFKMTATAGAHATPSTSSAARPRAGLWTRLVKLSRMLHASQARCLL
jgi:hypothetical protein